MSYEFVNNVSKDTIKLLKEVLKNAVWKDVIGSGRDYKTWYGLNDVLCDIPGLTELWPLSKWDGTFFLKIPPGGKVHYHTDTAKRYETFHIPVTTNNKCESIMYTPEKEVLNLKVGSVYSVNRQVPHESKNKGTTDRIHLLIQVND